MSAYLHAGPAPSLGRMGSLLALECTGAVLRPLRERRLLRSSEGRMIHVMQAIRLTTNLMLAQTVPADPTILRRQRTHALIATDAAKPAEVRG